MLYPPCSQAKEDVSEAETHDVKFKSADGLILEAMLVVFKVPAAPATWQLRLDEVGATWAFPITLSLTAHYEHPHVMLQWLCQYMVVSFSPWHCVLVNLEEGDAATTTAWHHASPHRARCLAARVCWGVRRQPARRTRGPRRTRTSTAGSRSAWSWRRSTRMATGAASFSAGLSESPRQPESGHATGCCCRCTRLMCSLRSQRLPTSCASCSGLTPLDDSLSYCSGEDALNKLQSRFHHLLACQGAAGWSSSGAPAARRGRCRRRSCARRPSRSWSTTRPPGSAPGARRCLALCTATI